MIIMMKLLWKQRQNLMEIYYYYHRRKKKFNIFYIKYPFVIIIIETESEHWSISTLYVTQLISNSQFKLLWLLLSWNLIDQSCFPFRKSHKMIQEITLNILEKFVETFICPELFSPLVTFINIFLSLQTIAQGKKNINYYRKQW